MARLFHRVWRVQVDTVRFTGLSVSFEVEKSTRREPNKCHLVVKNLSASHRRQIAQLNTTRRHGPGRIRTVLEAGYIDPGYGIIFQGDLRTGLSVQEDDGSWTTTIEGEDGGRSCLWRRVNRSFQAGTPVRTVVQACAEAMGVGIGNLNEALPEAELEQGGATYTEGTVLSGPAPDELDGVLRSVGASWSIQNGALQILRRGQALQSTAVLLNSDSGLISATRAADGTVNVKCYIQPDVYPGRQLRVEGSDVQGFFRVRKAKYSGDTGGDAWYIDAECLELMPRSAA